MSGQQEGKYLPGELRWMARDALQARAQMDERWLKLLMTLMLKLGMTAPAIEREIEGLAA